MININKDNKLAFSLFETIVVMGIVAIFVTVCANVFTKKRNRIVEKFPHGRFECYYSGGTLKQQYFIENMPKAIETVSVCKFKPIKNAAYYIVNIVGGGGAGSNATNGYGGSAGEYGSFFITSIEKELEIIPGKGATVGGTAEATVVKSIESTGEKTIASVNGGVYGFNKSNISGDSVSDCNVTNAKYICTRHPVCKAYTSYVQISYCNEDDMTGTNPDAYITENYNYSNIKNKLVQNNNILTYEETSNKKFKISMTINTNMTVNADMSEFTPYLKTLGVEDGIVTVSPGDGGAKGQPGNNGGAVIIW